MNSVLHLKLEALGLIPSSRTSFSFIKGPTHGSTLSLRDVGASRKSPSGTRPIRALTWLEIEKSALFSLTVTSVTDVYCVF